MFRPGRVQIAAVYSEDYDVEGYRALLSPESRKALEDRDKAHAIVAKSMARRRKVQGEDEP